MKEIKLTQGKVALVDDEDFEYLSQFKWQYNKNCTVSGYARRNVRVNGKVKSIPMHREILGLGWGNKTKVDHKDRNGLNNQKSNLRHATVTQNNCNRRLHNKHKYRGVTFIKNGGYISKWRASIVKDGRRIPLGHYKTVEEAALAYNEAAKKYQGEFAVLNDVSSKLRSLDSRRM